MGFFGGYLLDGAGPTRRCSRELIAPFIADDTPDEDDADIFVEVKVATFLRAAGFPVPTGLPRYAGS